MDGKRVLFLGGASGIGAATIRLFAERGAAIAFGDIQTERGEALAAEIRDAGGEDLVPSGRRDERGGRLAAGLRRGVASSAASTCS